MDNRHLSEAIDQIEVLRLHLGEPLESLQAALDLANAGLNILTPQEETGCLTDVLAASCLLHSIHERIRPKLKEAKQPQPRWN
jgi:hypothetical protein